MGCGAGIAKLRIFSIWLEKPDLLHFTLLKGVWEMELSRSHGQSKRICRTCALSAFNFINSAGMD